MAKLIFMDSFDHYSTAQGSRKWTVFSSGSSIGPGRTGNGLTAGGIFMPNKTFGAEYPTLTAGVAQRVTGYSNGIVGFGNGPLGAQIELHHVGDGRLSINISFALTSSSSPPSTFVMSVNRWYYFELQATIGGGSSSTISATARVNEGEILSYSHTFAAASTTPGWATVYLSGPGGGDTATCDDFYCTDTEFLGDIKIGVLYPNAAGDSTMWTPNTGAANYTLVKEHTADDDGTYVSTPNISDKDLYNLDDVPPGFVGEIKGAQALWLVKKSDAGGGAVKGVWKSGSTELTQASGFNYAEPGGFYPSDAEWLYDIEPERKSLFTSADWTPTELNGLQLGVKRTI